jgi:hypothetical protein
MPVTRGKMRMNWTRFALIAIGAGIVTSLTDWFFAGDWLHRCHDERCFGDSRAESCLPCSSSERSQLSSVSVHAEFSQCEHPSF